MKYVVEVNAKWLVSVEADSVLNAEHKLLDYEGIWGANAFDQKALKTDTFAGCVACDEFVSMNELIAMVNEAMDTRTIAINATNVRDKEEVLIKEMEAKLAEMKKHLLTVKHDEEEAIYKANKAQEKLGKRRN